MSFTLPRGGDFSSTHTLTATPHATFAVCSFEPRVTAPRHGHSATYFGLVLDGGFEETYGSRSLTFTKGSLAFHPASAEHATRFAPARTRAFRIELSEAFGVVSPQPVCVANPRVVALARRLHAEFRLADCHSQLVMEGLLFELVGYCGRDLAPARGAVPKWLRIVVDAINDAHAQPLTVASLASLAGVHAAHLTRVFRQHNGMSVGAYVRAVRIRAACERLAHSDEPLAAIAVSLGFCDQSHFANVFRRAMGMTPREYRAAHR